MESFGVIMFAVIGAIVVAAVLSLCHNHCRSVNILPKWLKWYGKTHPMSKTASGHLIRVVKGSTSDEYKLSKSILGKGTGGVCRVGIQIKSKKKFAIKTIELKNESFTEFYKREIDILKDLEHLNIIRVFEVFEKSKTLGIVMELCTGGHLGEVIVDTPNSRLDEDHALRYVCQLLGAVMHCHEHGVCHRDIKLQNILLENRSHDAQVKLIDFGNSKRFTPGTGDEAKALFRTTTGTTYTMAPEVFKQEYDERCDIWSLGVVSYIMLSGQKPFESIDMPNHPQVAKSSLISNIMMGRYSFQHAAWEFISEEAMMFIMTCFTMNFRKRPSAVELYQHKWCSSYLSTNSSRLSTATMKSFSRKLRQIPGQSLSQTSMIAVAFSMPSAEARDLRSLFQIIDKDGSGKVDREEFCAYMQIVEPKMSKDDINTLFNAIDQDGNQEISFLEFVASMVDSRSVNVNEINQAFNLLDQEGKGYISHSDLYNLLAIQSNRRTKTTPTSSSVSSQQDTITARSLSRISFSFFQNFSKAPKSPKDPQTVVTRRKSQETSIGDVVMPQCLPEEEESNRLDKIQEKVKNIIDQADQDGDGKISYAEFLVAMSSGAQPIIPEPPGTSPSLSRCKSPPSTVSHQKSDVFEKYDPRALLMSFSDAESNNDLNHGL